MAPPQALRVPTEAGGVLCCGAPQHACASQRLRWLGGAGGDTAASVQVVPLPYPLQMGIIPLTYPLRVPLTLKAWEGLSVRGSS